MTPNLSPLRGCDQLNSVVKIKVLSRLNFSESQNYCGIFLRPLGFREASVDLFISFPVQTLKRILLDLEIVRKSS